MFLIWGYYAPNYTMVYSFIFFRNNSTKSNDSNLENWDLKILSFLLFSSNLELFFLTYITCMFFYRQIVDPDL